MRKEECWRRKWKEEIINLKRDIEDHIERWDRSYVLWKEEKNKRLKREEKLGASLQWIRTSWGLDVSKKKVRWPIKRLVKIGESQERFLKK